MPRTLQELVNTYKEHLQGTENECIQNMSIPINGTENVNNEIKDEFTENIPILTNSEEKINSEIETERVEKL